MATGRELMTDGVTIEMGAAFSAKVLVIEPAAISGRDNF